MISLAAAAVTVGLATGTVTTAPSADATEASSKLETAPVVLHGVFPGTVKGVQVFAEEPDLGIKEGESLALIPVDPEGVKVRGSSFQVAVSPESLPTHAYDDGVVTFRVVGQGADKAWMTVATARAVHVPKSGASLWVDPVASSGILGDLKARSAGTASARSSQPGARDALQWEMEQRAVVSVPSREADELRASDMAKPAFTLNENFTVVPARAPVTCHKVYQGNWKEISTTIGTSYPVGASRAYMNITSSNGGSYGVAMKSPGGAFGAAGTSFKKSGWGFTWSPSKPGVARSYRKGIEYRYYKILCRTTILGYEWRPHGETGGTGINRSGVTRPGWNTYCTPVAKGTWRRTGSQGSSYKLGTGVKSANLVGFNMSVDRSYSASTEMVYQIKGSNPKKMCGNDSLPARSGKQIERVR